MKQVVLLVLVFLVVLGSFTLAIHTILAGNTLGADFATFWIAGQAVFVQGADPYSPEVTRASQLTIYKRLARPDEDQLAFAYPPHSLYMILPTAWMDVAWAQAFWMALNILACFTLFYLLFPGASRWVLFTFPLLYPVFFGIVLGNFAVPVSLILILVLSEILLRRRTQAWLQILCGVLLAWATAKPQFVWLYLGLVFLVVFKRRLWPLGLAFASTVVVFLATSLVLVPGWIPSWLQRVQEYAAYVKGSPTLTIYLSAFFSPETAHRLTWLGAAVCAAGLVWLALRWWKGSPILLPLTACCGFVTYLFHPHGISYEQITFLIPLFLWAAFSTSPVRPEDILSDAFIHRRGVLLVWIVAILLSWAFFALTRTGVLPSAVNQYPLLAFSLWLLWLLSRRPEKAAR